jgi:hypothetical protein
MIEFLVPALGLTGLLPKLIRAADNINLSGLAHWVLSWVIAHDPIRRVWGGWNRGGQCICASSCLLWLTEVDMRASMSKKLAVVAG